MIIQKYLVDKYIFGCHVINAKYSSILLMTNIYWENLSIIFSRMSHSINVFLSTRFKLNALLLSL